MKPYLSPKETVFLLKSYGIETTADTVREWCRNGVQNAKHRDRRIRLGAVKIGGRVHIRYESLVIFIPLIKADGQSRG